MTATKTNRNNIVVSKTIDTSIHPVILSEWGDKPVGPKSVNRALHYWAGDGKNKGKILVVKEHHGTYYCAATTLEEYLTSLFKIVDNYVDYCPWLVPDEPRVMEPKHKGMLDMSEEAVLALPDGLKEIAQKARKEWADRQQAAVRQSQVIGDIRRFIETGDALGLAIAFYNHSEIFPFEINVEYLQDFSGRINSGGYG